MRISMGFPAMPFHAPQVYALPRPCYAPRLRRLSVGGTITRGVTTYHSVRSHGLLCGGDRPMAADQRVGFRRGRHAQRHPERRRAQLDRAYHDDGADTPRRVRATARQAEAVTRTW
jgi:hypothetical protein